MATSALDAIRSDAEVPAHVPRDRVADLGWAMGFVPNNLLDPYAPCGWLSDPDVPRILYNPGKPGGGGSALSSATTGSWIVTHYEDIDRVYTDNDLFSNAGTAEFQRVIGETFRSIPLAIDPPDHHRYRLFLMPFFSPARLNRMGGQMRNLANEMIDDFAGHGAVDAAWDFSRIYPVRIFMALMGFPPAMFEQFLDWEWDILHGGTREKMAAALRAVLDYLRGFMAEKRAEPDEHLVSHIVHGSIDGQKLSDEEQIGMVWFLWLGGLDTVAATMSQMFRRLALQPEIQRRLRDEPALIPTAIEEFLRTQPILSSARTAKRDFDWHGVTIKAGETIQCLNPAGNFDPARFADPRAFDPARKPNRHFTFVAGIHLCLGAPLARRELRIVLEEWLRRIPAFQVSPGADTTVFPGLLSIRNLPLIWNAADAQA